MNDLADFDLMGFTPYRVTVAAQKLSEQLAQKYRSRFGISTPEWRILVHLTQGGGASVRDIEAKVAMEKSKVSRAASRLEERGLIKKLANEQDRRLVRLDLTPAGRDLLATLLPMARDFQAQIESVLGPHLTAFETALDTILAEYQ